MANPQTQKTQIYGMATNPSDDETKDPMELSTSPLLESRSIKAMSTDTNETDEEVEDEEEEGNNTDEPDWDKDSFEGMVYDSDEDHERYSDEEFTKVARAYNRMVIETKGFFKISKDSTPFIMWTGICPVKTGDLDTVNGVTLRKFLESLAIACVEEYKNRNKTKTLIFHEFLRANWSSSGKPKYYITFNAKESDSPDAPDVEYQAKAACCAGKIYPILCRPSPTPHKDTSSQYGDERSTERGLVKAMQDIN